MGHHAAPRLPDPAYTGVRAYLITSCTWRRIAWFTDAVLVERVYGTLLSCAADQECVVLTYCFIPDHVHLLIESTSDQSRLRRVIEGWKQKTAFEHRRATRERLWQPGYHDHVLRSAETVPSVVRYLLGNPLRARLVSDVRDYPFWGSARWSREALLNM